MDTRILLFSFLALHFSYAQHITHGPVTGNVTDTSATIYLRTTEPANIVIYALSPDGETIATDGFTQAARNNSNLFTLKYLKPNTLYQLSFEVSGEPDTMKGSFTTFPRMGQSGNFTITTGSCQETPNMKVFDRMAELKPRLFIHTGDFTYPSYQMNDDYPIKYESVQESYLIRYKEKRNREMLWHVPMDYIPDDDDGWGAARTNGVAAARYYIDSSGRKKKLVNFIRNDTFPDAFRHNCFKGYAEQFPHYPLPDTSEGLYHKFTFGNCDFFVIDTRATADNQANQFDYDSAKNKWTFNPKPNIHIISPKQMQWLKQQLISSNADWKFIVSGLPFNQNIKHLIDIGMKMQDMVVGAAGEKGTGFRLAVSFATYWAGYPNDSEELLGFIKSNNLQDIIVVSGDTHHNEIDDGRNAGLPEINASGLSVTGTHLGHYMDLMSKVVAYPGLKKYAWNGGGGGLGNKNYKNQFGKIDINGKNFVQLNIVDEDGKTIAGKTIWHSSSPNFKSFAKQKPYQKRLARMYGKKPSGWMQFLKALAKLKYKP